nr:MAG TPA: hypothetical protein [Caudoviricetes sp.]
MISYLRQRLQWTLLRKLLASMRQLETPLPQEVIKKALKNGISKLKQLKKSLES